MSSTTVDTGAVPSALRDRDQWVCWRRAQRDGKQTKIPIIPGTNEYASATDPETWSDFETARASTEDERADGIGFVFTENDDLVGVDLDGCRDPETGEVTDVAQEIIRQLESYTEISPSGTGFHVLVEGSLPAGRNRRGGLELYDSARFFTVTGEHVPGMPTHVARREDAVVAIHREYLLVPSSNQGDSSGPSSASRGDELSSSPVALSDDELLARARKAANGAKFERLWAGSTTGYDSHSEADMALCCLLAFWAGGDESQVDRLFRQSCLYRRKWDDVHYADGSTYGERTIERAIATTSESYEPTGGGGSPPRDAGVAGNP